MGHIHHDIGCPGLFCYNDSLHDRRAGLVLIAEVVSHILTSRKQSRAASWSKLSATIKGCAEATAVPFPESGTSLSIWSNRPSGPHPALPPQKRKKKNRKEEIKTLFLEYHLQKQAVLYFFWCCLIIRRPPFFFDVPRLIKFIPRQDSHSLFVFVYLFSLS